jgi:hypothetical protein
MWPVIAHTSALRRGEICSRNILSDAAPTSKRYFVEQKTRDFSSDFEVGKEGPN